MKDDPIVAEVRKAREEILRQCDHDLDKLFRYLRRRQKASGLKVVKLTRKRPKVAQ
jgi:hypothetical protein